MTSWEAKEEEDSNIVALPPDCTLRIGYKPVEKVVMLILSKPESEVSVYFPLSSEGARELSELLLSISQTLTQRLHS